VTEGQPSPGLFMNISYATDPSSGGMKPYSSHHAQGGVIRAWTATSNGWRRIFVTKSIRH
jgi:hypothetical protein